MAWLLEIEVVTLKFASLNKTIDLDRVGKSDEQK